MERHQAGQEETLVQVMVERDSVEVTHRPRGSPVGRHHCFNCVVALATVMGLIIVALVTGFILHFFIFTPSCNQDPPPSSYTGKVNITCKLKKSDQQGRYDIFTSDKAAAYLIYGWVRFPDDASKEVTLMHVINKSRPIDTKTEGETVMFFFAKVKMVNTSRISIHFKSRYINSSFHVYEL